MDQLVTCRRAPTRHFRIQPFLWKRPRHPGGVSLFPGKRISSSGTRRGEKASRCRERRTAARRRGAGPRKHREGKRVTAARSGPRRTQRADPETTEGRRRISQT
ncbi:hypothetical protein NDU88_005854 [Pleurodeles waltl]|uniref:Uncharacterized protein n=1 Tax=Pleurodeles waltl TaxID=8319 RepID=A0AAV7NNP7_PLEWA|nr:hypothetical protein NDU88_005854 [Pleurodeles waltl]